jgi:hypothetical protein
VYASVKEVCCHELKPCFDTYRQLTIVEVLKVGTQVTVAWSESTVVRTVQKQLPVDILPQGSSTSSCI